MKNANATSSTKPSTKSNAKRTSKKSASPVAPVVTVTPVASTTAAAVSPPSLTPAEVSRSQSLLTDLSSLLGPVTPLTPDDIRQSVKLRKGGAQVITQLIALCNHHGVTSVGPATVESMTAEMARAELLNTIGVHFAAVGKQLSDATFSSESSAWEQATALYTILQRLSLMDPTLAQGLAPLQAFFQTVRTKGTKRAKADALKVKAAAKLGTTRELPATATATTTATAAPPAASRGTTVSAPAAAVVVPTNGIAHS
jgi:hypothetical protein